MSSQLVGEHRLALDQPVSHWLPGLLSNGDHITVRELLNHTSGLYDYTNDPAVLAGVENNQIWDPRQLVAIAESHPAMFPPGTAWGYSNTNYIVAGLLIEAVTGQPLTRELQQRIFTPLGLKDISFPADTGQISGYYEPSSPMPRTCPGAYWNQSTGRTVVLAATMDPLPATATTPLANAAAFALCG